MRIIDLLNNEVTERELLSYYNASVTYEKLPDGISGFVYSYKGVQNIFINRGLSYYKRKKTLLHELAHIELNQLNHCLLYTSHISLTSTSTHCLYHY